MSTLRKKLYSEVSHGLWARRKPPVPQLNSLDAIIFDIDGVLVDVCNSYPSAVPLAVQYYFNGILNISGSSSLVNVEDGALFKMAGGFNNDCDVANGCVSYGLMKLLCADEGSRPTMQVLSAAEPSIEKFTASIKQLGGGLDNTLTYIRDKLGKKKFHKFQSLYKPEIVKKIFMEYYAGNDFCHTFFGHEPKYYRGTGFVGREVYLLKPSLLENLVNKDIALGVLTGRNSAEANYVLTRMGLDRIIQPGFIVVDEGSLPSKPDPSGMVLLRKRMRFNRGLYVGDNPDDWNTVLNFRNLLKNKNELLGCMVETGAKNNKQLVSWFEESQVDYLARDVNWLIKAIQT